VTTPPVSPPGVLEGVECGAVDELVVGGGSGAPDDRGDHFDDPVGPAGTPTREGPRHPDRSRRPDRSRGVSPTPGPRRPAREGRGR